MRLIDSHCHLNYEGLVERQAEVLDNARARGVAGFLNISTRQREWGDIVAVATREPDVWASVGVHPHEADAHPDLGASALADAASHPRVIAIGVPPSPASIRLNSLSADAGMIGAMARPSSRTAATSVPSTAAIRCGSVFLSAQGAWVST